MPNSFSIENDITPMRNRFFSSGLKGSEASYLNKAFGPSNKEIKETIDIYNAIDRGRNADLQYQMNLEALQQRRDDAQREREAEARLGEISNTLLGITNSEGSPEDRAAALADYKLENPNAFNSPAANNVWNAAAGKLGSEQARIAKAKALQDKEEAKVRAAIEAGNVAAVRSRVGADGEIDERDKTWIAEAGSFAQTKLDQESEKTRIKFVGEDFSRRAKELEEQRNLIDSAFMEEETNDYVEKITKLNPKVRNQLERTVAETRNKRPAEIRALKLSADELREEVEKNYHTKRKAYEADRGLFIKGQASGYSSPYTSQSPRNSNLQNQTGL